ncbi:Rne/Rng family ribonuclease [Candidatus Fermentibacterales bacterium]|nr:Rne/Rng family ribonuclease [Candidatus Fermentibacterales bacterium]
MKTDFIVNVHPDVTRIALREDERLMELIVDKADSRRIVGNIYLGSVSAVLPGMQAAFVDIGLERSAFLHVSDLRDGNLDAREFSSSLRDGKPLVGRDSEQSIESLLRKGQEILVQVTKEPIGTKGARVSTRISIAGRYVVSMPGDPVSGVSRKIGDRRERQRLRKVLDHIQVDGFGIIARTVGTGQSEESFSGDIQGLIERWKEVGELALASRAPALLHQEYDAVTTAMRDMFSPDMDAFITDSKEVCRLARQYLKKTDPGLARKVRYYRGRTPIFDHYGIEPQIDQLLHRDVPLKSGGSLVIEHTEALVAIDVNTRRYVGKRSQESTILKTNMEAAKEVARQLRLRDLGGLIVIDFIDMENEEHREKVLQCLRSELGKDRSPTKTCQVSTLGLVEMTRKRVRPSLIQALSEPCEHCGGSGRVMGPVSAATRLERFLERAAIKKRHRDLVVSIHPSLAAYLLEDEGRRLDHLCRSVQDLRIELHEDPGLRVDGFRVYSLDAHEEIVEFHD